ncbi:hypothetical protein MKW92_017337, partial [Papaver armeniacum]
IYVMATTMHHSAGSDVQAPGILTLKDFQQKNGIGPWMARVRIVRIWHETDFMKTNDVTSFNLLLLDDTVSSKLNMICSRCWFGTQKSFQLRFGIQLVYNG